MSSPRGSRTWLGTGLVGVLVGGLVVVGGAVAVVRHRQQDSCGAGDKVVSAAQAASPLLTPAELAAQPDKRLARLVAAVRAMPAPFGKVVGGIGYDYGQYLQLAGLGAASGDRSGLGVWTKDNGLLSVLSQGTLAARWGIEVSTDPHAWDSGDGRFVDLDLRRDQPLQISAYDVTGGARLWCTSIGDRPTRSADPLSTEVLADGDVLLLSPGAAKGQELISRLAADDGQPRWQRSTVAVDRGDFVGDLGSGVLVAGGWQQGDLADANQVEQVARARPEISGFDEQSGKPLWSWTAPAHSAATIVGSDPATGRIVVLQRTGHGSAASTARLFALDRAGRQVWSVDPGSTTFEATQRSDVLLTVSGGSLVARSAVTGAVTWQRHIPTDHTFFPYGFTLDQMPYLDARHVLMPTTTDLRSVALSNGSQQVFKLPTDGINTTFWPYQLIVTDQLIGIVTNTGGVVVDRS